MRGESIQIRDVRPSGREGQDGIETIKGLNGTLFINTENSRMGRRLQVETDDCGRFFSNSGSSLTM